VSELHVAPRLADDPPPAPPVVVPPPAPWVVPVAELPAVPGSIGAASELLLLQPSPCTPHAPESIKPNPAHRLADIISSF
jgi:hypothetical protein